jgi:DNA-binding GntR family transcriptional regulator
MRGGGEAGRPRGQWSRGWVALHLPGFDILWYAIIQSVLRAWQAADEGPVTAADQLKRALSVSRPVGTLRTQAVEKLRQAIIDGHFAPGVRLTERELCELLGVSRTLVREALRQLEAEGWIENVPYRGPTVAMTSADEARQLYEIRAALEGFAAKQCAERATKDDLDELGVLIDRLAEGQQNDDLPRMLDVLDAFHEKLLQAAGNPMMTTYLHSLRGRLRRLRGVSLRQPGRALQTVEEKRVLLRALKQRDGDKARQAREQHVLTAARNVVKALEAASE